VAGSVPVKAGKANRLAWSASKISNTSRRTSVSSNADPRHDTPIVYDKRQFNGVRLAQVSALDPAITAT
jgi:hypothetical protein